MRTYDASSVSRATPGAAWDAWIDVARWGEAEHIESAHVDEPTPDGTVLTERVHIRGPLAPIVGPLLRRRLEALFAASVAHVARTAQTPGP